MCGATPARLNFGFPTAGAITTQAEFDAATPVATVPPPPPGNHDAGGAITPSDARLPHQPLYPAGPGVGDAGNLPPPTSPRRLHLLRSLPLLPRPLGFGPDQFESANVFRSIGTRLRFP